MIANPFKGATLRACLRATILAICVAQAPSIAHGDEASDAAQKELWNKITALPWVVGPKSVAALQGATLQLHDHYIFLDVAATPEFMNLTENPRSGDEREQVFGPADLHWFAIIDFSEDGYVSDKEEIDANAVLENIKKRTEQSNEMRRQKGWAEMHIIGWNRAPYYDTQTHQLEWAIDASNGDGGTSTNFNTRILGRRGVTSAVLVTDPQHFEADLGEFKLALAGYSFDPGERYSEFQKGDKVAAYGLSALILGGATAVAAKTGLLKTIGKFLWIVVVGAGAAIWGFIKRLFGGRRAS
jgi:uncharacterized membrane-anchored protein